MQVFISFITLLLKSLIFLSKDLISSSQALYASTFGFSSDNSVTFFNNEFLSNSHTSIITSYIFISFLFNSYANLKLCNPPS